MSTGDRKCIHGLWLNTCGLCSSPVGGILPPNYPYQSGHAEFHPNYQKQLDRIESMLKQLLKGE